MNEQEQLRAGEATENVPLPADSGVAGTQAAAPAGTAISVEPTPLERLQPLPRGLGSITHRHPRAFGGEVNTELVAAITQHLGHSLDEANHELRRTREELERTKSELRDALIAKARLEERARSDAESRSRRHVGIALGSGLTGLGINLGITSALGIATVVIGAVLVVTNWVSFSAVADWLRPKGGSR